MTIAATRVVARRHGGPEVVTVETGTVRVPARGQVRLRVLATSVGSTDVLAIAGRYLLHPVGPVVAGYDLVGEIIDWHPSVDAAMARSGLVPGSRVAACLPGMGAHVTAVNVPAWQVIPVPEELDTVTAAAVPLDGLTAVSVVERHAKVEAGQVVLVQGASGPVGRAITERVLAAGGRVLGTASARHRELVEATGATFVDYREGIVPQVRDRAPEGVDALLDHRGGPEVKELRDLVRPGGVVVSYAFGGRPGHERWDTVAGSTSTMLGSVLRRRGVRSALCTIPFEIRLGHGRYRRNLAAVLDGLVTRPSRVQVFRLDDVVDAYTAAADRTGTGKVVLFFAG